MRCNFDRWVELNPGYEVRVLDRGDVDGLLSDWPFPLDSMPPAALSDIVRAKLLVDDGGVWADASVFPVKPLDEWLPELVSPIGFFAFERPAPDRPVSSWFLACSPGHELMGAWWREVRRFWERPRTVSSVESAIPPDPVATVSPAANPDASPYFWYHYLFQYVLEQDPSMAHLWENCRKLPAEPAHDLQTLLRENPKANHKMVVAATSRSPVQKLDWRKEYPVDFLRNLGSRPAGLFGRLFSRHPS